jgi:hypothetical protein
MKTQFSRRELYALGEPLGESATRVVAGRRIYGGGGGAGVANMVGNVANGGMLAGFGPNPNGAVFQGGGNGLGGTGLGDGGGRPLFGGGGDGMTAGFGGQNGQNTPFPGYAYGNEPKPAPFSNTTPTPTPSAPSTSPMSQIDSQQGVAGYAQPYVNTMLGATMQNLFDYDASGNAIGIKQYNPYSYNPADYVAGFSPLQQQAQQGIAGLRAPYQTQQASNYANQAIQGLMNQQYNPQTGGYMSVSGSQANAASAGNAPTNQAAQFQGPDKLGFQSVNNQGLTNYQMGPAERVGVQNFGGQSAQDYMNPYMQNVVDIQQREAQRQADIAGTSRGAQAAKSGAFGGSRQAIMDAEAARNLATQKGDIQAQGLNTAYTNAQQQFNADQARQLQAQQANQQAGLTTGQQNLAANLGVQSLGAGQNLQSQLANQQAGLTSGQANQNMQYNTGLQNAQLAQQANLANQAIRGQYGLANAGYQQQANLQNAQQQQQANLANQQANQQAQNLAAQQQQFGANYGMQGLQGALSGANTLGNLGTQQLNNQLGIYNAQNTAGNQQQQQQQNIINQGISNYNTAQQYPMQQLGQMRNMLQGLPITTTSQQSYQAAPTNLQNIMALGMGGYGLNQLMGGGGGSGGAGGGGLNVSGLLNSGASGIGNLLSGGADLIGRGISGVGSLFGFQEGGPVKSYAQGGVTSEENVRSIANFLPTPQLPKSFQMAQGRGDVNAQNALEQEMAERTSLQRGLGSAFNQLPQNTQQNIIRAAKGGIVAFTKGGDMPELLGEAGGYGYKDEDSNDDDDDTVTGGSLQEQAARSALKTARRAGKIRYTPTPAEDQQELTKSFFNQIESLSGKDPYAPMLESLKGRRDAISENMGQAKGLAALKAMSGMLQPGGAMRGLGGAAGSFADSMEKAQAAKAAEERSIELMNFNLMDAQRKERSGNVKGAMDATAKAEQNKRDAAKSEREALIAQGTGEARVAQALRQVKGAGGADKERDQAQAMRVYGAELRRQFPEMPQAQLESQALQKFLEQKGSGLPGVDVRTDAATQKDARTSFNNRTMFGGDSLAKEYRAADKAGDTGRAAELKARIAAEEGYTLPGGSGGKPTPVATNPAGKPPDINAVTGAPKGARIGEYVQGKGYEVKDSKGKLIGYAQGQ